MEKSAIKSNVTVLVVDDSPGNLALLLDTLGAAGYTVLVALNGSEAIERARAAKPQIILLDVMMPGFDGFATCRQMKAEPALRDIPIIFMTARDETESIVEGLGLGAVDYIRKPVHPDELKARIAAQLRRVADVTAARATVDASGRPTIALDYLGRVAWSTPQARILMRKYFADADLSDSPPPAVLAWLQDAMVVGSSAQSTPFVCHAGQARLSIYGRSHEHGWLLLLSEDDPQMMSDALCRAFALTEREGQVLLWLAYGKTNREIGEILNTSPRTVNKHLEHIFEKIGTETRTAAAAAALRVLKETS